MPPKVQITKQTIVEAAAQLVRARGPDALNARAVAAALGCSTQPLFSNYSSMDALKADVIAYALALYQQYLDREQAKKTLPPYKASGMAYIRFAKEEKALFRLLYMRDRSGETMNIPEQNLEPIWTLLRNNTGLSEPDIKLLHLEMWIWVHGTAAMTATGYLDLDEETVSRMMTDVYQGVMSRFLKKEEENGCDH